MLVIFEYELEHLTGYKKMTPQIFSAEFSEKGVTLRPVLNNKLLQHL